MSQDLIFYTNPMSRGRIVRWMLEEAGADYRTEVVAYGPEMRSPEYLAINPMGKVPAIRHGETVVSETPAICAYLAEAFPGAGLVPPVGSRGAYYRWFFFAAGPLEYALLNQSLEIELSPKRQGMAGYGTLKRVLDTLEAQIPEEGWLLGADFSAVDVYLGAQLGWAMQFGTIEPRPAFERYWARLSDRPAWRRASELDDAAMAEGRDG